MPEKYQKEIEEILRQAGEMTPSRRGRKPGPGVWQAAKLYAAQSLGGKAWSLSAGRILVVAICLLLLAAIFSRIVPGIGAPLALAALLLGIGGYGMLLAKPRKLEKRWRGQTLDEGGTSWWDRIRRKQ
mgnify:CR=1 FL=1